jgi:dihydroorotate dehydrogenase electron transfer subunit
MVIELLNNMKPQQVKACIVSREEVMPGVFLIWLEAPEIARITHAGQFVMLKCYGGALLRRPLSVHRVSRDKTRLAFLFAVVGKGTGWLSKTSPCDHIDLLGPLGHGFEIKPGSKNLVLVAGGLGIAPLCMLSEQARSEDISVILLLGAATAKMLYPDNLLPDGVDCVLNTDDGSTGRRGLVTDCLPNYLANADQFFACGPLPMLRTIAGSGVLMDKNAQVSLETRMACGLGVCYGCTIKTHQGLKQVCKDGPVFNLNDIIWDELADI